MAPGGESRAQPERPGSLAILLRAWRERALLTQEELAERAGVSVGTVRGVESGRIRRPHSESLRLLADGLGLSAADRAALVATARGARAPEDGSDSTPDSHGAEAPITAPTGVPRQLPAPAQMFTGRTVELADLNKIHDASTVVITAIDGMAGVGKSALAVQAAHQMADRYPDGQLFLDLHGYTHGVAPVEPGEALDRLLRSLGVAGERIPAGLDERAGLYRSRLADQRMLIVLDNAAAEAQVTPLLPGAPGCVVLVTSRRRLAGLDDTHTLSLETLPPADAIALFRRSVSESRLAGQPSDVVAELVELCGRLPLAIRLAAARLRSHPAWDLDHLLRRLRDRQHRLAELAAGHRSVTSALDLSYQDLSADLQRAYRLLGLHPGADIEPYAAAALLDATLPEAGRLIEQLHEFHLFQEPAPGRYRFHDLVRAHAARAAARDETVDGRRQALDRLLDHYRHTAAVATDAAYPYERERRPQVPPACTPSRALSDPAAALGWLDNELPNLLAAASYATQHDRPEHILHLSTILHRHLRTRGFHHDAGTLHQQALTASRATGDQAAELETLVGLGHTHRLQGRYEQATDHFQRALQLARATGHGPGELDALVGLGRIHALQGRYGQATDYFQQALQLARAAGHPGAEMEALGGLGHIHRRLGRYEQATDLLGQALRLARATGHRPGELAALGGLGYIHRLQGRYEQATDHFQQALQLARATGNRTIEQGALGGLGHIHRIRGQHEQASDHYQRQLELAHEDGDRNWQFEAWQGLGRLQLATGRVDAALTHHAQALTLATELGQPVDQARAHDGLAHAHHALHQHEQARTHWQHALDILTRLGIDHTDDEEATVAAIRTHLANLGRHEWA
jgi:tetratricopeptide (TPR) repeat protein/transcriptional regulator with XRE-family HTH domain